jgi:hypothetical protein
MALRSGLRFAKRRIEKPHPTPARLLPAVIGAFLPSSQPTSGAFPMQLSSSETSPDQRPRNWWMEILVILGVLGFGYFAVTLETSPRPATEAQELMR